MQFQKVAGLYQVPLPNLVSQTDSGFQYDLDSRMGYLLFLLGDSVRESS